MALISKKNGKNWYYQFKYKDINGKIQTKSVNTKIPKTHTSEREKNKAIAIGLKAREEFLNNYENEILRIQGITDGIDYSIYTFEEYSKHWLNEIQHEIQESTAYDYKLHLNAHINPIIGNIKLNEINRNTIKYFFDTEFNDCLSKIERNEKNYMQSIGKHLSTLSCILDFAYEENAIIENPVPNLRKRYIKQLRKYKVKSEIIPYSWDELMKLKEVVLKSDVHIEAPVIIGIYTGLRREEILGLRWQDIDFDNKLLFIRNTCTMVGTKIVYQERTKTEKSRRTVPIIDELYTYLLSLKEKQQKNKEFFGDGYINTDLVCVWPDGKPIKPVNLSKRFTRLLADNNLRKIRFYDLRHSFGTVLYNSTGDIKLVSSWLGHSNISTTSDIYVKTDDERKQDAAKNFNPL